MAGSIDNLERTESDRIKKSHEAVAKLVLGFGLFMVIMTFALAGVYLLCFYKVPDNCNSDIGKNFRILGICNILIGVFVALGVFFGQKMFKSMYHAELAEKYEEEGRMVDADREREELVKVTNS